MRTAIDKGLTSGAILDTIEDLGAGYVAKAKLTSKIMGQMNAETSGGFITGLPLLNK